MSDFDKEHDGRQVQQYFRQRLMHCVGPSGTNSIESSPKTIKTNPQVSGLFKKFHGENHELLVKDIPRLRNHDQSSFQTLPIPEIMEITRQPRQSNENLENCRSSSEIDDWYKQKLKKIADQESQNKKAEVDKYEESLKRMTRKNTDLDEQNEKDVLMRLEQVDKETLARREKIRQIEAEIEEKQLKFEQERKREQMLFEEKLHAQNIEHQKKIEAIRTERERIEKEAEQEFEEHLKRLEEQKQAFWSCIQLKLRFEEKEQEWADFLQTLRNTLHRPKIQCSRLKEELERGFEDLEEDNVWIEQAYEKLHSSTLEAYGVFYNVFFFLQNMSKTAEDRVFLRILMKSAADISNKLCGVLDRLDNRELNQKQKVDFFKNIDYYDVPSTRKLKELSKHANFEDYLFLEEPLRYRD